MVKILYLASNPQGTTPLDLARESRTIKDRILASSHRDTIELVSEWAVRISDLRQFLLTHRPDVVHFSGHQNADGKIVLVDDADRTQAVPVRGMVSLFKTHPTRISLVVYNACDTAVLARATSKAVGCAIGMRATIEDEAAIVFAAGLYRGIGFGFPVREAFEQARSELALHDTNEHGWDKLPVLYPKDIDLTLEAPAPSRAPAAAPPPPVQPTAPPAAQDLPPPKLGELLPKWATNGTAKAGIDFVIVTALPEEREAVLRLLPHPALLPPVVDDIRVYYAAELPVVVGGQSCAYKVIVMPLLGMGRVEAAAAVKDAIRRWRPRFVLLAGIAGGVAASGAALGDVLLADQIADYSLGKVTPRKTEIRWRAQWTDRGLVGRAMNLRPDVWRDLVKEKRPGAGGPQIHVATVATGDKVVAASRLLKTFAADWPKLIGVEMEAGGAALACFDAPPPQPGFFMVRGVSDLADAKKDTAAVKQWRAYACDVAAAFAVGLLRSGPIPLAPNSDPVPDPAPLPPATAEGPRGRPPPPAPRKISIFRMPVTAPDLFGRDAELQLLDSLWDDSRVNVVTLIAWGGVGKTALVNGWLRRFEGRDYEGARAIYAWSFYTHGTAEETGSGLLFVESALAWFGDPAPTAGTAWEKGERLARLVKQERTLLLLDGLEPLQFPPPGAQEGRVKEQAVSTLLRELAADNPGLCIVSSRLALADLADYEGTTVRRIDLEHVTPRAGAQLLRNLGVVGRDAELEQAAADFGGHCLALKLLGSYLTDACGGDVRRRGEVGPLERDVRVGGHAQRVMKSYEAWFDGRPEVRLLRVLGLFDRPADADALNALKAPPAIPELTDGLAGLNPVRWGQVVASLRRAGLISGADRKEQDSLDTHPLVREYFREQLRNRFPAAWREGNNRLYERFKTRAPQLPTSVKEMEPLFQAVVCGCNAGRERDALHDVYLDRIMRGDELYAAYQLGALTPLLSVVGHFFDEGDWSKPVEPKPPERQGLDPLDQWTVLMQAGMFYTAAKSYAAQEAGSAFSRAVELSQDDRQRFLALRGLWAYNLVRNHIEEARQQVKDLREVASRLDRSVYMVEADMTSGVTCFWMGEFTKAGDDLEKAIATYDFEEHRGAWRSTGTDPCVVARTYHALAAWSLGDLAKAFASRDEALRLAEQLAHPFSKSFALYSASEMAYLVGDPGLTEQLGQQLTDFATQQGSRMFVADGHFYSAWARYQRRTGRAEREAAVGQMKEAVEEFARTETAVARSLFLVVLAGAWGAVHGPAAASPFLREARALIDQGDRHWEAEWFRVQGDLELVGSGGAAAATASYEDALATARRQEAKSLELRAATSYARLLDQQGQRDRARELLGGVFSWFREGHYSGPRKLDHQLSYSGGPGKG